MTSVDVASEAGVSQATVARVFSAPDKVAPATRAKVQAAADRLGYVPNAIARSLKSQRTNIIGAVVPAFGEYWQHVVTQFSQRLSDRGLQLLLFSFTEEDRVERAVAAVDQYRLDGLIMASAVIGPEQLARMSDRDLPLVAFNQPAAAGIIPSVSVDNEEGARRIAEHVVDVGVERALFVGGVASTSTDSLRYRGAAQALGERGVACPYLACGAFSYEAGYKAAAAVLERQPLPDAVIVSADELALGLIDGLRTNGVDVPGELLVTGFDGLPQVEWTGYDLTTLVQNIEGLTDRAIDLLLDQIERGSGAGAGAGGAPVAEMVPGTLRVGATTTGRGRDAVNHDDKDKEPRSDHG
ncbi:MAG: LacI family DNA-binding transcriptional regulator [Actinomycetota bacterium]